MLDRYPVGPEEYERLKRRSRLLRLWAPVVLAALCSLWAARWISRKFNVAPPEATAAGDAPHHKKPSSEKGPLDRMDHATKTEGGLRKTYRAYVGPDGEVKIVVEEVEPVE